MIGLAQLHVLFMMLHFLHCLLGFFLKIFQVQGKIYLPVSLLLSSFQNSCYCFLFKNINFATRISRPHGTQASSAKEDDRDTNDGSGRVLFGNDSTIDCKYVIDP